MQALESWNQSLKMADLLKTCPTGFPGAQGALLSTLSSPQRVSKVNSCSSFRVPSQQRQMANALGELQFVVEERAKGPR